MRAVMRHLLLFPLVPLAAIACVANVDGAEVGSRDEALVSNVAAGRTAYVQSSSVGWGGTPDRAVDGNTDGDFWHGSVFHDAYGTDGWWQVDLGQRHTI